MSTPLRVGIYGRVYTSDQNAETQLLPLREFVASQGFSIAGEFVDHASATDLKGRTAWRRLLDQASQHKELLLQHTGVRLMRSGERP